MQEVEAGDGKVGKPWSFKRLGVCRDARLMAVVVAAGDALTVA